MDKNPCKAVVPLLFHNDLVGSDAMVYHEARAELMVLCIVVVRDDDCQ